MTLAARQIVKRAFPKLTHRLKTRKRFWSDYWFNGEWELRELQRYVDQSRGAIDVGGNIGIYSYHLSRLAAWVMVFEPNPFCAAQIEGLDLPNTTVRICALSDSAGTADLHIPVLGDREAFGMASLEKVAVQEHATQRTLSTPLITLDSLNLSDVGFLKIDVEGHEEAVLAGAVETIRSNRPALLIEIEERHNVGGLDRIATLLRGLGYSGYFFLDRSKTPLAKFDASIHQVADSSLNDAGHNRRGLRYINNFLFVPN